MKLIDQIRAKIRENLAARSEQQQTIDTIVEGAEARGDGALTEDEATKLTAARSEITELDKRRAEMEARVAEHEADAAAAKAAQRSGETVGELDTRSDGTERRGPDARVKAEPRTYSREAERYAGRSFVSDVIDGTLGNDRGAQDRLMRHMEEEIVDRREAIEGLVKRGEDVNGVPVEFRAVSTSNLAGLTVPQYLTDLAAPVTRNARPFADICRSHELPIAGMTVELSRGTTGTSVAVQATENAAVSETDYDDTQLTVNVRTYAGQQTVSRQSVDRSTGGDAIIIADLVGAYSEALDSGILNDDGTSGTHLGVRNVSGNVAVTYTDASPTSAELLPKHADLMQQVQAATNDGVTHFIYHPRRWWWQAVNLSSTFPMFLLGGNPRATAGAADGNTYAAAGSNILGAGVVLDRNIPTNLGVGTDEDAIVGVDANECHLWEDPDAPMLIRAEQTSAASLGVLLVVYGYSAFTAGRYPLATGDITGTGLVDPTF